MSSTKLNHAPSFVSPVTQPTEEFQKHYAEGAMYGDGNLGALFFTMFPNPLPSYTPGLLKSIGEAAGDARALINHDMAALGYNRWKYIVVNSQYPGIFNLGGDLELFVNYIRNRDYDGLLDYGKQCVDLTYQWSRSLDLPVMCISLVQGTAQGGGLEMALASNLVIAERGVKVGYPETTFGLFAGMTGYHVLADNLGHAKAKQIFLSGKSYDAEEFHEMGLIDILAEKGEGHHAVLDVIRDKDGKGRAREAIRRMRTEQRPLNHDHLIETVTYWADAAMSLSEKELGLMERIIKAQKRKLASRIPATNREQA